MKIWTDSERKWAQEPESKPKIKEKHMHHKEKSNYLTYNSNSH